MDYNKDLIFEQQLNDLKHLKEMYESGQIQGLSREERELLEFCHNTDMHKFLKENVQEKPIVINGDGSVNWQKTRYNYQGSQQQYVQPQVQQPMQQQPQVLQQQQKFYYLYDDEGNMIAAIPKK